MYVTFIRVLAYKISFIPIQDKTNTWTSCRSKNYSNGRPGSLNSVRVKEIFQGKHMLALD